MYSNTPDDTKKYEERENNYRELWSAVVVDDKTREAEKIKKIKEILLRGNLDLDLISGRFFCDHTRTYKRQTPLMAAARKGYSKVVSYLIEAGADVNFQVNGGWTALMEAVYRGNEDCVKVLLDKGANVNIKSEGITALILVRSRFIGEEGEERYSIFKILLDQENINVNSIHYGVPTLHDFTGIPSSPKYLRYLLNKKARIDAQDESGSTALMRAVQLLDLGGVKALLECGIKINTRNNKGLTALDIAEEMLKDETKSPKIRKIYMLCRDSINNEIKYRKELTKIFDTNPLSTVSNIILSKLYYPESINYDEESQTSFIANYSSSSMLLSSSSSEVGGSRVRYRSNSNELENEERKKRSKLEVC